VREGEQGVHAADDFVLFGEGWKRDRESFDVAHVEMRRRRAARQFPNSLRYLRAVKDVHQVFADELRSRPAKHHALPQTRNNPRRDDTGDPEDAALAAVDNVAGARNEADCSFGEGSLRHEPHFNQVESSRLKIGCS